jgi:hypothetical protein
VKVSANRAGRCVAWNGARLITNLITSSWGPAGKRRADRLLPAPGGNSRRVPEERVG